MAEAFQGKVDEIQDHLNGYGFSDEETEHAARCCVMHMAAKGYVGIVTGGTVGYFLGGATALPLAVAGGVVGSGSVLLKDPNCEGIRAKMGLQQVINIWNNTPTTSGTN